MELGSSIDAERAPEPLPLGRGRFFLLWLAPSLLLLAFAMAPLAAGERTLFLRDTLKAHLALRAHFADAFRRGELPLVDPLRAGGQGLLGNPNALALYPDNALLLVAPTLWQHNAHFWLHWFAAFGGALWLARSFGLGRRGAAAAAAVYAFSGHFVSQLNLYNGVASVALAPALAAALLEARRPERRRWALPALGALWALELLGGDPTLALLVLAAAAALAAPFRRELPGLGVALALAGGTLLAAPQWVETARLLPGSFRGVWGPQSGPSQAMGSPRPEAAVELLLPFFFGRPDANRIWGAASFGGVPPLYFTLAPGLIAIALAAAGSATRGRGRSVLLALLVGGLLLAHSGAQGERLLKALPGGTLFRFVVKLFLLAALALALLAGRGLERALVEERSRRLFARSCLVLAALAAGLGALFAAPGGALAERFVRVFAPGLGPSDLAGARAHWTTTAVVQLAIALSGWLLARALRGRPGAAGALLVALHAGTQLLLVRPALPTDEAERYRRRPALLDALPAAAVLAHGGASDLFGPWREARADLRGAERLAHEQLQAQSGLVAGRRFELNYSPEGLDSFLVMAIAQGVRHLPDAGRVRVLAATGVDLLLLSRPLAPEALAGADLVRPPDPASRVFVYRVRQPLEEVQLLGTVRSAPHVGVAFDAIRSAGFAPRVETIVAGAGAPRSGPRGRIVSARLAPEEIAIEAESEAGGVLVVRRSWLPIWEATIDGQKAQPVAANATRLALELPPGRHAVRFWIDRTPLRRAVLAALAGALLLGALALRERLRRAA